MASVFRVFVIVQVLFSAGVFCADDGAGCGAQGAGGTGSDHSGYYGEFVG